VRFPWAYLGLIVVVVAGCAASQWLVMRDVRRAIAESHREMDRRLQSLLEAFSSHGADAQETLPSGHAQEATEIEAGPAAVLQGRRLPRIEVRNEPAASGSDEIAPEIQAAIAAAAIAMLGRHARVQAARRVPSQDLVSPWTQQGRVIVQSSHNLRSRGR
jgi:hypothetical protein